MFETIEVVRGSRVAVIWLNRPEVHNALNEVMVKELTQAINESAHDAQINAIVLASRGDSFCSGTDLNWCRTALDGKSGAADAMTAALANMLKAIESSPVPVIARVNGHCVGAGVGLVAAADIAAYRARFLEYCNGQRPRPPFMCVKIVYVGVFTVAAGLLVRRGVIESLALAGVVLQAQNVLAKYY